MHRIREQLDRRGRKDVTETEKSGNKTESGLEGTETLTFTEEGEIES